MTHRDPLPPRDPEPAPAVPLRLRRALVRVAVAIGLLTIALIGTFALPVSTWRTGDQGRTALSTVPGDTAGSLPRRIWIDTDAACGVGRHTDPDDCFAIVLLARDPARHVVGISTVYGNAPLPRVEATTRALVARLAPEIGRTLPVYRGSTGPWPRSGVGASRALVAALEDGPLTIVALGPLTNVAAALANRPELRPRVARLVTVMGRRPGHLFHPAEGARGGVLFGHGPVFRDFNFAQDELAAERVVRSGVPITLVPYDAARHVLMRPAHLDRLAAAGGASAWVSTRARDWADFWRDDIGRDGFAPFDLLAAGWIVEPGRFRCAPVRAAVRRDPTLFFPVWRPTALLVDQEVQPEGGSLRTLYCAQPRAGFTEDLVSRLVSTPARKGF